MSRELTKKVVRKKVEENLGWEENVLNAPEYKGPLQKEIQDMTASCYEYLLNATPLE